AAAIAARIDQQVCRFMAALSFLRSREVTFSCATARDTAAVLTATLRRKASRRRSRSLVPDLGPGLALAVPQQSRPLPLAPLVEPQTQARRHLRRDVFLADVEDI